MPLINNCLQQLSPAIWPKGRHYNLLITPPNQGNADNTTMLQQCHIISFNFGASIFPRPDCRPTNITFPPLHQVFTNTTLNMTTYAMNLILLQTAQLTPIVLVHNGESETNKLLHNVFVAFHNQSELIATQGQRLAHVENGETLNPSSRNFSDGRIIPNILLVIGNSAISSPVSSTIHTSNRQYDRNQRSRMSQTRLKKGRTTTTERDMGP